MFSSHHISIKYSDVKEFHQKKIDVADVSGNIWEPFFDVTTFSGKHKNRCHQLFGKYFSMFQPFWEKLFDVVVADDNIENFHSTLQFHARTSVAGSTRQHHEHSFWF